MLSPDPPSLAAMSKNSEPSFADLLLWTLQAVEAMGGAATSLEIRHHVSQHNQIDADFVAGDRFEKRLATCRSLARREGWLRSEPMPNTNRKRYLLLPDGEEVLRLPAEERWEICRRVVATPFGRPGKSDDEPEAGSSAPSGPPPDGPKPGSTDAQEPDDPGDEPWKERLLTRLLALNDFGPSGWAFEWFVIWLLREYGLELRHTGRSWDEGIDAIGRAPLSDVLTVQVVVQCKCVTAATTASRAEVAQLQSDASRQGAERAIFVTLGTFTSGARNAADSTTPNVELVDGEQLIEMLTSKGFCVRQIPGVPSESWDIDEAKLKDLLARSVELAIDQGEADLRRSKTETKRVNDLLERLRRLRDH